MAKGLIPAVIFALFLGGTLGALWKSGDIELPIDDEHKQISVENPYEHIAAIDAYYNGQKIWFLHTDVSDEGMAKKLSKMVGYGTHFAPVLADIPMENVGKFYVFTNGISTHAEKPWGGGPFNYQIDIFDSIPGDPDYTPIRQPHLVTWNENATPHVLINMEGLLDAETKGELTIKPAGVIVNVPIIKWPGGQSRV